MKCPECEKDMKWIGDSEDTNEESFSYYECEDCKLEIRKYWN